MANTKHEPFKVVITPDKVKRYRELNQQKTSGKKIHSDSFLIGDSNIISFEKDCFFLRQQAEKINAAPYEYQTKSIVTLSNDNKIHAACAAVSMEIEYLELAELEVVFSSTASTKNNTITFVIPLDTNSTDWRCIIKHVDGIVEVSLSENTRQQLKYYYNNLEKEYLFDSLVQNFNIDSDVKLDVNDQILKELWAATLTDLRMIRDNNRHCPKITKIKTNDPLMAKLIYGCTFNESEFQTYLAFSQVVKNLETIITKNASSDPEFAEAARPALDDACRACMDFRATKKDVQIQTQRLQGIIDKPSLPLAEPHKSSFFASPSIGRSLFIGSMVFIIMSALIIGGIALAIGSSGIVPLVAAAASGLALLIGASTTLSAILGLSALFTAIAVFSAAVTYMIHVDTESKLLDYKNDKTLENEILFSDPITSSDNPLKQNLPLPITSAVNQEPSTSLIEDFFPAPFQAFFDKQKMKPQFCKNQQKTSTISH